MTDFLRWAADRLDLEIEETRAFKEAFGCQFTDENEVADVLAELAELEWLIKQKFGLLPERGKP